MYGLAFNKLHVCQHWEATEIQNRYVKLKKHVKKQVLTYLDPCIACGTKKKKEKEM